MQPSLLLLFLTSILTVTGKNLMKIPMTPGEEHIGSHEPSEVWKCVKLVQAIDISMNTMKLYLENINYYEVEELVEELNHQLVFVPRNIIQHPTLSLLMFNEATFNLSYTKCSCKAAAEQIESTVKYVNMLSNLSEIDGMYLLSVTNSELAFLLGQINEKLAETQQTFSNMAKDMKTIKSELLTFQRTLVQVIGDGSAIKVSNKFSSFSKKLGITDPAEKHNKILQESVVKIQNTVGDINNLILIFQTEYIQTKSLENMQVTANIKYETFDQSASNALNGKKISSPLIREIIINGTKMLDNSAKSYIDENKKQEVFSSMKRYDSALTTLIGKDDVKLALEKIEDLENIIGRHPADITNNQLLKNLNEIPKVGKCTVEVEHELMKFNIRFNIGNIYKEENDNGICLCQYWNSKNFKECHTQIR